MMDLISMLGYSDKSPYKHNPYLDINTPDGRISMADTSRDLIGIDNTGMIQKMKANRKKPYQFKGDKVREISVSKGGNPYQKGGMSTQQLLNIFYGDKEDMDEPKQDSVPQEQQKAAQSPDKSDEMRRVRDQEDYDTAMQIALAEEGNPYTNGSPLVRSGNPFRKDNTTPSNPSGNPYTGDILSSGQFGNKNVGNHGREIYGEVTASLGYNPVVNSIFRSKSQNDALIAAGKPASKNSWHLTGNAIDLKPKDWKNLSKEKQAYFRQKYDVVYHDNHYHIEPK